MVVILQYYTRTGLLFSFEVLDLLEHGVDVAVDFVALAPAIYAAYYQTYNASYDYAK